MAEPTQSQPRFDDTSQHTMPSQQIPGNEPTPGPRPPVPPPPPPLAPQPDHLRYKRPSDSYPTTPILHHPAQQPPPQRRQPVRRSGRRGISCGPSCLIGCLGFIGITIIATLFGGWVAYASYSEILDERLDEFDKRVEERDFQTTFLYDRQGRELYQIVGEGRRERISLDEIPDVVRYATIALEDDSFYDNIGVDIPSILRAARDYVREGEVVSGASTITQQLVRNVLFDPEYRYEQSLHRKIDEAMLAIVLTRRMSKDDILELYLNEINYGNLAYGIEAAANVYFGKSASELALHEAALLAGLPQAPLDLDPLNPDPNVQRRVIARQHLVLDLMVKEGYITQTQADLAKQQPLIYVSPEIPLDRAPHFVFYVQDELLRFFTDHYIRQGYLETDAALLAEEFMRNGGLHVYTTVDLDLQAIAEEAAQRNVAQVRDQHDLTNASVVAMIPPTGEILAMVGSIDFNDTSIDGQVNVALAQRQPGSTMKPFTYSAAMEQGWVPASVIWDTNVSIGIPGQQPYEPVNYDRLQHGPVHMRDALANSYNIPAVKTLREVGVQYLLDIMHRFGVQSLNRDASNYGLSLTLGGGEVTLLELTNAYGVFARNGALVPPSAILCIIDNDGNIFYEYENGCPRGNQIATTRQEFANPTTVLDPRIAFVISDILSDNDARTPAMGANSPLNTSPLVTSVKTGTTNDFRDNWTVGYTPNLVVGVWSGNSDNHPMRNISGLQGAAPIWRDTITAMYNTGYFPQVQIAQPPGLYQEQICNVRYLTDPAQNCSRFRTEWFFDGGVTVPDGSGGLVPSPYIQQGNPPPAQYGPQLTEVQPDIIQTYVRPLSPDQVNLLASQNPGSVPQRYCMVPVEILSSVPDAQLLLFARAPEDPEDAKGAYNYAFLPNTNYAILPQFACTPDTIAGGFPPVTGGGGGEREVTNNTSPYRIYCQADGSIDIYQVVNNTGVPVFRASPQEIAAVGYRPPANTLIKQGGNNVRLYRLTSGELQVNAPVGDNPNGFVFIWDGC